MKPMDGQMALNLFPEKKMTLDDHIADWVGWLCKFYGCSASEVEPIVRRLCAKFPMWEAFDRCKALASIPGWSVGDMCDAFGLFDSSLDYHTCWDRHLAALKGYPRDEVEKIIEWDYGQGMPRRREE